MRPALVAPIITVRLTSPPLVRAWHHLVRLTVNCGLAEVVSADPDDPVVGSVGAQAMLRDDSKLRVDRKFALRKQAGGAADGRRSW